MQLQYIYVISRFTSYYVENTLRNKLYTYILYINDVAEHVNKHDSDNKESGGSGGDDDDVWRWWVKW